jgi:hypothetical protein
MDCWNLFFHIVGYLVVHINAVKTLVELRMRSKSCLRPGDTCAVQNGNSFWKIHDTGA